MACKGLAIKKGFGNAILMGWGISGPCPQVWVEMAVGGMDEGFWLCLGLEDGEEGGAGSGHEDGMGFAAFEEPEFEFCEVAVFGEDGFFEVVEEFEVVEFLAVVGDAGEGFRIEAVAVGIEGWNGEVGFEEDEGDGRRVFAGLDDFAASGAACGAGVEKKGDVGAE